MAGKGGYQAPANPAPVSGPGSLSQRTDGGPGQPQRELPNAKYGEAKEFREAQQGAPMAADESAYMPIPFGAPTQAEDEELTAGLPVGAGPGPEAMGMAANVQQADFQAMKGLLPGLEVLANLPQSNPSTRALVRYLKSLG